MQDKDQFDDLYDDSEAPVESLNRNLSGMRSINAPPTG